MNPLPFSGIRIDRLPNEVRYQLPSRDLGSMKWFGLLPISVGAVFLGVSGTWCLPLVRRLLNWDEAGSWFTLLFLLGGLPFLCVGGVVFAVGVGILLSQFAAEVRLSGEVLRYTEGWGILRKSWTRNLRDVGRVSVVARMMAPLAAQMAARRPNARPPPPTILDSWAGLRVDGASMEPLWMAMGYPAEVLRDLARQMVRDAGALSPHQAHGGRAPIELVEANASEVADRQNRPAAT